MSTAAFTFDNAHEKIGQELGVTAWHPVTQDEVNRFADVTHDHDWMHVDPVRAKKMRAALVKWLDEAPSQSMGRNKNVTKEMSETLASLGYSGEDDLGSEEDLVDADCTCVHCAPFR